MIKTKVGEWLEMKFLEWQTQEGQRKTIGEFAIWIGVHRVSLSRWMNTENLPDPSDTAVDKIGDKLGPEIYDLLEVPRPDPRLREIIKAWGSLPENIKNDLLKRAENGQTPKPSHAAVAQPKRKQKA
jgi:hypothetical protein